LGVGIKLMGEMKKLLFWMKGVWGAETVSNRNLKYVDSMKAVA